MPGRVFLAGVFPATLRIWDVTTGKLVATAKAETQDFGTQSFSPDGKRLAWAFLNNIKVLDVATGKELLARKVAGFASHFAYSPDGKQLLYGSPNGGLAMLDGNTGKELFTIETEQVPGFANVGNAVFSPDGRFLASPSGQSLRIWDTTRGVEVLRWKGPDWGQCFFVQPEGKLLAVFGRDRALRVWELAHLGTCFAIRWGGPCGVLLSCRCRRSLRLQRRFLY